MDKKRVALLLIFGIIFASVGLISAGWWSDLFSGDDEGLEGELPASFDVGVQMTNQAPTITSWTVPAASPTACTTTALGNFVVTVTDPDGGADLVDGVVTLRLNNTHATLGEQFRPATPVTCVAGTPVGNTLAFTCSGINMNFWDDAGTGDPWFVTVTATDGTNAATNSPRTSNSSSGNYPHFIYTSSMIIQVRDSNDPTDWTGGDDTITWTDIQTTSSDAIPTNNLITRNCGNAAVTTTSITGKKLDSTTTSTDICPHSFSVRAAASPCNVGAVLNWPAAAKAIASSSLAVYTTAEVTRPFYFCLEDINNPTFPTDTCVDPITVGTYNSVGNPWDITFA